MNETNNVLPYSFSVSPGKYHRSTDERCVRTTQRGHKNPCNVRQCKRSSDCKLILFVVDNVVRSSACSYYSHSLGDISQRGVDWFRSGSLQVSLTGELQSYSALSCCIWKNKQK